MLKKGSIVLDAFFDWEPRDSSCYQIMFTRLYPEESQYITSRFHILHLTLWGSKQDDFSQDQNSPLKVYLLIIETSRVYS